MAGSARYAEGTLVSPEKSRGEIERTLERFGATGFAYGRTAGVAQVMFELSDWRIRFTVALPVPVERRFTRDSRGRSRTAAQAAAACAAEERRVWRSLLLVVKAKLEAVRSGLVTVDEEFLSHIVLPDNSTVGDWARDQLKGVSAGEMPALLPGTEDR